MKTRVQVAIIGGGPAGMLLSHLLDRSGVDNIVLERKSRKYVLSRIRAGVLEPGSADLLRKVDLGSRMDGIGRAKDGTRILWEDQPEFFIDVCKWTGSQMMAYGQTYITEDLYRKRLEDGAEIVHEVSHVGLHNVDGSSPCVTYEKDGQEHRIDCDFIAGCDGYHGPSRQAIPSSVRREYRRTYEFAWLGIMVRKPPLEDFIYSQTSQGIAVAAQRNEQLSRYYIQTPVNERLEDWPDDRFWETLLKRFPAEYSAKIQTGDSIEKSLAPLRAFVSEPMRYGSLFLAGDAAHIVPPTGAKGLNLAFSNVSLLAHAFDAYLNDNSDHYLSRYSETALRRVWSAMHLSCHLTDLLHAFPDRTGFAARLNSNAYEMLRTRPRLQAALAFEYAGLACPESTQIPIGS